MNSQHPSLERLPQVLARTGLRRSQLYKLQKTQKFPGPVSIGDRAVAWNRDEVSRWIQDRIDARDARLI